MVDLQRGVDLPSLDVTYFTSLSYYILLLFGLNGVLRLIFRDLTVDETQLMRQQMAMGGGMGPMGSPDPAKAFEAERHALEMVRFWEVRAHAFSLFALRWRCCLWTVCLSVGLSAQPEVY